MFYVMIDIRDEWGNVHHQRVGKPFKKSNSAINLARKYMNSNAIVYKFGDKIPLFATNTKLMEMINALRFN